MALEKAEIGAEGKVLTEVRFNPTQYSLEQNNQIAEIAIPGMSAPIQQYVRGNSRQLSMELFFDTYEEQKDVREHTNAIYKLLEIDKDTHVPPICIFEWKDFRFRCLLKRLLAAAPPLMCKEPGHAEPQLLL